MLLISSEFKPTNLTFFYVIFNNYIGRNKKISDEIITINKNTQSEILMTTTEEIVPENSLFHKIDKYIDFTFIYDEVKKCTVIIMGSLVLILLFYLN